MENGRKRGRTRADDTLVGREHEMAVLNAALDDVAEGRGSIVMLAGDPGIGKTRLCEEAAALAADDGMLVLWGRCAEQEGAPPYWPWIQVLRRVVQAHSDASLLDWPGAEEAVSLVPELAMPVAVGSNTPSSEDPVQARFRLLDGVTRFVERVSRERPLLLVLDNLHRADRASLTLLEFLGQELSSSPVLVLGTYRQTDIPNGHPLHGALSALNSARHFRSLQLSGLSEGETAVLAEAISGVTPSAEFISDLAQRTGGNPFFIGEVARLLDRPGNLADGRIDKAVPPGVRSVVHQRLESLSPACREAVAAASVIGRVLI